MVDAFYADNNRFQVIKANDIAFDSERPSIQLFPNSERIIKTNFDISFPNLISTCIYFNRSSDYPPGTSSVPAGTTYAESWSALIPQEWGPDEANFNQRADVHDDDQVTTRTLAQTLLGTVPADTDYIDVRVKLTRTTLPPVFKNQSRPVVLFQEGEEINLVGGSCPCEIFYPMIRHFDIVRDGTNVYLRRYQSTANKGAPTRVIPGGPLWVEGGDTSGWRNNTHGSATWEDVRSDLASLAVLHQSKGPDTSGNKRAPWYANATNPCAVPGYDGVPATNYTSVYTGDIIIHPGRHIAA